MERIARVHEDARLLKAGALPLHAAAFAWRGAGWAVTGESGAGKTGVLLSFLARGATYLAADRVVVSASGDELVGTLEPVRVRAWHARELPRLRRALDRRTRARFAAFGIPGATFNGLPGRLRAQPPFRGLAPWVRRFDRRIFVDVEPALIAGPIPCTPRAPFAGILLLERSARPCITRLDPAAAAAALAPTIERSLSPLHVRDAVHTALGRTLRYLPVMRVEHAHGDALVELVDAILDAMAANGGSRCISST